MAASAMAPLLLWPGMADALLFDIGRVVIDIDFNKALACWAGHAGCEPEDLADRFARDDIYQRHETGSIDDAMFFAGLRRSLGIDLSDVQFLQGWNAIFAGEMPGIAPLLARAAQGVPLYAFSNTNGAHVGHFPPPMPAFSAISAKCFCPP
jgi:FMN phosphatase YigB (HAD superfamily)